MPMINALFIGIGSDVLALVGIRADSTEKSKTNSCFVMEI